MTHTIVKYCTALSLLLLSFALWNKNALPSPQALRPEMLEEPKQIETSLAPFETTVGQVVYTVKPRYEYDLYGLVVSEHDSNTWWDYIHRESNDHLNVNDLCVVWGKNAQSGSYQDLTFSSGQFVCYVQAHSEEAYVAFDPASLSNNHMLSDDKRLAKILRGMRIGDQIHFRGYLAEYSHNHGFAFHRGTSTTRLDTGNGACETVYVTDVQVLHSGNKAWRRLVWFATAALLASILAWFWLPVRFRDV